MISRRNVLTASLAGILNFFVTSSNGFSQNLQVRIPKTQPSFLSQDPDFTKQNYNLLRHHIHCFLKNYITMSVNGCGECKPNERFRSHSKNLGLENFIDEYSKGHILCLDTAYLAVKQNSSEIKDSQYRKLGKALCQLQRKFSSSVVDYSNSDVISSQAEWARIRVNYFLRLLQVEKEVKTLPELVRHAYTRREFEEYVKRQNNSSMKLYDSIYSTVPRVLRIFGAGSEEIEILKYYTKKAYNDMISKFFPQEMKENGRHKN